MTILLRTLSLHAHGESVDLMSRVASGSTAALAAVYDAHAERLYAFARRLVGEDSAAEDLVHEVFLSLPAAAGRYRGEASMRSFLLAIAQKHALHHVRAAARRRAAMKRLEVAQVAEAQVPADREAERKQCARRLQEALDELPIEQRVALILCEVEELTSLEVAAIVGAPEGTVRTRVFHAKKKLRERLEREAL
jgi:RNA polymerase sigma-70 factor (ECF subfamily)